MRRAWRLGPLLLGFLAFVALGFGVRRSTETTPPSPTGAPCAAAEELPRLLEGLEKRVALALSPERRTPEAAKAIAVEASPWQAVADWMRRYQVIAEAVVALRSRPGPEALAGLQAALGEAPHPCLTANRWANRERFATALERSAPEGALSELGLRRSAPEGALSELGLRRSAPEGALSERGLRELGKRGCARIVTETIDALLARDPRLVSAKRLFVNLSQLNQPADPQQRLQQLRALQGELQSEHSPLVVRSIAEPNLGPDWGVSAFLRLRNEWAELSPEACLPETPARVQELIAARYFEQIAATGLFTQHRGQWRVSAEVARVAHVLDAFFELEFVQRRAPVHCRLTEGAPYIWDRNGLQRVARVLQVYQQGGQLEQLSAALRERDGRAFRKLWDALPEAACGKITQNLCVELNAARRSLPYEPWSELAAARAQAASLEETRDVWAKIAEQARAFGCSANNFGLAQSDRSARALLATAHQSLYAIHQRLLGRFTGLIASKEDEAPSEPQQTQAALNQVRREFSAITLGLVEPALEQLDLIERSQMLHGLRPSAMEAGASPESSESSESSESPESPALPEPPEPPEAPESPALPELDAWRALVDDFRAKAAFEQGGAAASAGQSGVFAYEQWYARLLSLAARPCDMAFSAWHDGVFEDSQHIFHRYGRSGSAELLRRCEANRAGGR